MERAVLRQQLFNRSYITYGESGAGTGNVLAWGSPRIMGGEVTFRFWQGARVTMDSKYGTKSIRTDDSNMSC